MRGRTFVDYTTIPALVVLSAYAEPVRLVKNRVFVCVPGMYYLDLEDSMQYRFWYGLASTPNSANVNSSVRLTNQSYRLALL